MDVVLIVVGDVLLVVDAVPLVAVSAVETVGDPDSLDRRQGDQS